MSEYDWLFMSDETRKIFEQLGLDKQLSNYAQTPIQPGDMVSCIQEDGSNLITQGLVYIVREIRESDGQMLALTNDNRSMNSSRDFTSWHPLSCFEK